MQQAFEARPLSFSDAHISTLCLGSDLIPALRTSTTHFTTYHIAQIDIPALPQHQPLLLRPMPQQPTQFLRHQHFSRLWTASTTAVVRHRCGFDCGAGMNVDVGDLLGSGVEGNVFVEQMWRRNVAEVERMDWYV